MRTLKFIEAARVLNQIWNALEKEYPGAKIAFRIMGEHGYISLLSCQIKHHSIPGDELVVMHDMEAFDDRHEEIGREYIASKIIAGFARELNLDISLDWTVLDK